jgi:hypothetical protein
VAEAVAAAPASTWPETPPVETVTVEEVQWAPPAPAVMVASDDGTVSAAPAIAVDPIDEIVAATAGFNSADDSIVDMSQNKVNMALFHIETLRQILPDLSNWTEDRAEAVNDAIAAMEAAIKGREADDDPYVSLRHTVAAAQKDPRDIDVMIALSDRSKDIEDLLKAHDKYSIGIRTALIDLKPLAVEYVRVPKARRPATRKPAASRSTASKSSSTANRSTASKSGSTSSRSTASKSTSSSSTSRTRKTSSTS